MSVWKQSKWDKSSDWSMTRDRRTEENDEEQERKHNPINERKRENEGGTDTEKKRMENEREI